MLANSTIDSLHRFANRNGGSGKYDVKSVKNTLYEKSYKPKPKLVTKPTPLSQLHSPVNSSRSFGKLIERDNTPRKGSSTWSNPKSKPTNQKPDMEVLVLVHTIILINLRQKVLVHHLRNEDK